MELYSYGKVKKETGEKNFIPFLYQGQYKDVETGLCYNRFRYYFIHEGMYVGQQDPIGLSAGKLNIYSYVDEPNAFVDPLGLGECKAAQAYEEMIQNLYGGKQSQAAREYSAIVNGSRVNGIADHVTGATAIEAKYVGSWVNSIRNPASTIGDKFFAIEAQKEVLNQAQKYSNAFTDVIYHSNSQEFINHYSNVFSNAGLSNIKFILTPK